MNELVFQIFLVIMNFVDTSKKRINPSAKENKKYMGENISKFLNNGDPERIGDYFENEPVLINTSFHYGII